MSSKAEEAAQANKRRRGLIVAAAGAAVGSLVAAKLLVGLLRSKDRDSSKELQFECSLTPADILSRVDELIQNSTRVHDAVASVPLGKVSFEAVIAPLAKLDAEEFARVQSCVFPSLVSSSREVREASLKAEKEFEAHNATCRMREDVYRVVKFYSEKGESLHPDAQRLVSHMVRDYERMGLHLSPEDRAEVEKLKRTIAELCISYQKNIAQENGFLLFTEAELAGLPPSFMKDMEKGKYGKYKVPLDSHFYFPIMQHCKVGSTRKALATAYDRRCISENAHILYNVVKLRHRLARLLGFSNHVEYVTSVRMAKNFLNVKHFLLSLSTKMSALASTELGKLRSLKKAEEGDLPFGMEDLLYYMQRDEDLNGQPVPDNVKEYFPLDVVIGRILSFYEELLGLVFEERPTSQVWHSDVRLFAVADKASRALHGYFYLDIYYREGKYPHACVCPLQPAYVYKGTTQLPVAAMLANFTKGGSVLMEHQEVETFAHEFCHVMHHICCRRTFARFSGLRVEDDFVEAPSKVLEKWCSDASFLKGLSGFYKDTGRQIPDEMCASLVRKKKMHAGLLTKKQILLALFDLIIHSGDEFDSASVLEKLHIQVMEGIPMLEDTDLSTSFAQLMGGYDGSYYSDLWSQVLSEDIFESKLTSAEDIATAGREFRHKVLEPGASKDATDILQDYLGREPSLSAFVKAKSHN